MMKNLLMSTLVIGALVCPVAMAHDGSTTQQQTTEHAKKKQAAKKPKAKAHHEKHLIKGEEVNHETKAEKKIDEETELNNR